ncbi:MAG: SPASM domain-containing protein [Candidatus Diapherotrites archaeon]|uniref:SPASM domain-containing protein n=1 Tax=Candidatus Iainarchaeum sp. TaxID=3101447 RepID=A0A938YSV3_9ARCH|nr:SPASM domain-containing protein [Candidatus Diapherotrites archaeon]
MNYYFFQAKRSLKRFVLTPYFGVRKFFNAAGLFAQFGLFKNSRVLGMPLKLSLDPTSICQLKCPLCPTGQGSNARSRGRMEFSSYKKLVDEIAPFLYEIDLNNWGEPFLNKDLIKMIGYAHKKRIRTSVNTNLNVALSESDAEKLVKSGLDVLYISMDGITQKTYEKYRVGGNLQTVWDNIALVSGKKKELGLKKPRIFWQFLVSRFNEHELPELQAVKERLGVDELVIGFLRSDMGKEIFTPDREKVESLKKWLPKNESLSRYDYKEKKRKLQKGFCHFLWFVSVVNWNGSVSPCCASYNEKLDFGNAFKEGFKTVWNNEKYVAARKAVASRKPESKTVCDNCIKTGFID